MSILVGVIVYYCFQNVLKILVNIWLKNNNKHTFKNKISCHQIIGGIIYLKCPWRNTYNASIFFTISSIFPTFFSLVSVTVTQDYQVSTRQAKPHYLRPCNTLLLLVRPSLPPTNHGPGTCWFKPQKNLWIDFLFKQ